MSNPRGVNKFKAGLGAVVAVAASGYASDGPFDTRGREDLSFDPIVTAQTGATADTHYMKCEIHGCGTRGGTYSPVPGLVSGQLLGATPNADYGFPTAANATGIVLPPFIRVYWRKTGTVTGFSATVTMRYRRNRTSGPPGRGSLGDTANAP